MTKRELTFAQAADPNVDGPARVALVLSHDEPGGARNLWEQLGDGLLARNLTPAFHCLYAKNDGCPSVWQPVLSRVLRIQGFLQAVRDLRRCLENTGARVTLSAQPAANVIAPLAGALAGLPLRITSHHTPVNTYSPMLRWLDMLVGCTPAVSRIVCVSEGVRMSLDSHPERYRRKVKVIRNALAPAAAAMIEGLARVRQALPEGQPVRIVAAGRLAEQKNYPVLIRAMSEISNAVLYVLGDGPDRAMLEQMVLELGLNERVTLLGHRSHAEALKFMAGCDVFVQPSLYEGHSVALLEAAALGLPLVVSDAVTQVDALRNRSGELCGLVAAVDSPSELAAALRKLCEDPLAFADAARQARELARESSFDRLVEEYLALSAQGTSKRGGRTHAS